MSEGWLQSTSALGDRHDGVTTVGASAAEAEGAGRIGEGERAGGRHALRGARPLRSTPFAEHGPDSTGLPDPCPTCTVEAADRPT